VREHLLRRHHGAGSVELLGAGVVGEEGGALRGLELGQLGELVLRGENGRLGGEDVLGRQREGQDGSSLDDTLERGELLLAPAVLVALDALEHGELEARSRVAVPDQAEDGGLDGHELVLDVLVGEDQTHGVGVGGRALLVLGERGEQGAVAEVCRGSSRAVVAVQQGLGDVSGTASGQHLLLEHRLDHGESAKGSLTVHAGKLCLGFHLVDEPPLALGSTAVAVIQHEADRDRACGVRHGADLRVLACEGDRDRHHHGWGRVRSGKTEVGEVSHV